MISDQRSAVSGAATRAELARWLVRAKGWPLVHPARPTYADVPLDASDAPYIETLAAHRITSSLWLEPPAAPAPAGTAPLPSGSASASGPQGEPPQPNALEASGIQNPRFKIQNSQFYPEAPLSHADFAEAMFLAARDVSPLFAELPGPAVWRRGRSEPAPAP